MTESVLFVAHQYWPEPGPASQRLMALVAELRRRGHEVHVITSSRPLEEAQVLEGPAGEIVHFTGTQDASGTGVHRIDALLKFMRAIRRIGALIEYSIVVTDPPPTAAWVAERLAKHHNAAFVYYLCDSWGSVTKGSESRLVRAAHPVVKWLEDRLLSKSDLTIVVTEKMRSLAADAGATNALYVPNGADLSVYRASSQRAADGKSSVRPYFLYAGNAGLVHGAHVFAEAAVELWRAGSEFDVVYLGRGADISKIQQLSREWPGRLRVGAPVPPAQVASEFQAALGTLASLRPWPSIADARPTKVMAGLATGCPVVYASSGSFADELRENGLGFVTEWSVQGAKRSMEALLALHVQRPAEERRLREHCAQYARAHFDQSVGTGRAADGVLNTVGAVPELEQ